MSKYFLLVVAVASGVWLAAVAPARAQSYPLTCRIGTMNTVELGMFAGPNNAVVDFTPASGPAANGVQAGQCAWTDRPFKPNEPHGLCFSPAGIAGIIFSGKTVASTNSDTSFTGPGAQLLTNAVFGPPVLMNFMVHQGQATLAPCLFIDKFGM